MDFDEGKGRVNVNGIARSPRLRDVILTGSPNGSLFCNFISLLGLVTMRDGTGIGYFLSKVGKGKGQVSL